MKRYDHRWSAQSAVLCPQYFEQESKYEKDLLVLMDEVKLVKIGHLPCNIARHRLSPLLGIRAKSWGLPA